MFTALNIIPVNQVPSYYVIQHVHGRTTEYDSYNIKTRHTTIIKQCKIIITDMHKT